MVLRRSIPRRLLALSGAVVLTLAACGDSDPAEDAAPPGPAVAGACEPGVVECDDTLAPGDQPAEAPSDEPTDEPTGDEPIVAEPGDVSSGVLADGGLSVEEALATDATGVLAVRGVVVADGATIRLCDLLLESLPPQCGGSSVELANLDTIDAALLQEAQGVRWTDVAVVVFGELVDGVLVPSETVTG